MVWAFTNYIVCVVVCIVSNFAGGSVPLMVMLICIRLGTFVAIFCSLLVYSQIFPFRWGHMPVILIIVYAGDSHLLYVCVILLGSSFPVVSVRVGGFCCSSRSVLSLSSSWGGGGPSSPVHRVLSAVTAFGLGQVWWCAR